MGPVRPAASARRLLPRQNLLWVSSTSGGGFSTGRTLIPSATQAEKLLRLYCCIWKTLKPPYLMIPGPSEFRNDRAMVPPLFRYSIDPSSPHCRKARHTAHPFGERANVAIRGATMHNVHEGCSRGTHPSPPQRLSASVMKEPGARPNETLKVGCEGDRNRLSRLCYVVRMGGPVIDRHTLNITSPTSSASLPPPNDEQPRLCDEPAASGVPRLDCWIYLDEVLAGRLR